MAATGQVMAYRCEQCGSPRSSLCPSYTSRDSELLWTLHLWRQPVLYCEAASPPRHAVTFALVWVGIPDSSLLLLGAPRIECNIAAFKSTILLRSRLLCYCLRVVCLS